MKFVVCDTYVKIDIDDTLHFDIIVSEQIKDAFLIFDYGKLYLKSIKKEREFQSKKLQLCHI